MVARPMVARTSSHVYTCVYRHAVALSLKSARRRLTPRRTRMSTHTFYMGPYTHVPPASAQSLTRTHMHGPAEPTAPPIPPSTPPPTVLPTVNPTGTHTYLHACPRTCLQTCVCTCPHTAPCICTDIATLIHLSIQVYVGATSYQSI